MPHETLRKGDFILFCPDDSTLFKRAKALGYLKQGACKGGYAPLLKEIVAVEGDSVLLSDEITVNGKSFGRPILGIYELLHIERPLSEVVGTQKFWVIGTSSSKSFDSRYFGAINEVQVIARVKPVLTW